MAAATRPMRRSLQRAQAYLARYGSVQRSEFLAMTYREVWRLHKDLSGIVEKENTPRKGAPGGDWR